MHKTERIFPIMAKPKINVYMYPVLYQCGSVGSDTDPAWPAQTGAGAMSAQNCSLRIDL